MAKLLYVTGGMQPWPVEYPEAWTVGYALKVYPVAFWQAREPGAAAEALWRLQPSVYAFFHTYWHARQQELARAKPVDPQDVEALAKRQSETRKVTDAMKRLEVLTSYVRRHLNQDLVEQALRNPPPTLKKPEYPANPFTPEPDTLPTRWDFAPARLPPHRSWQEPDAQELATWVQTLTLQDLGETSLRIEPHVLICDLGLFLERVQALAALGPNPNPNLICHLRALKDALSRRSES